MKERRKRILKRVVAMILAVTVSCCGMGMVEVKAAYTGMQFIDGRSEWQSRDG